MSNGANRSNFDDKTVMATLEAPSSAPYKWLYEGGSWFYPSFSDLFGDDIMQDLDENVMSPDQECTEDDFVLTDDDFIFPPPPPPHQEFQPQPSTSWTSQCEPTQQSSQDSKSEEILESQDLKSQKSLESPDCIIIDSSDEEEDTLMRISNTFFTIKPPKSALLPPPNTTVTRDLPFPNTFKPPIVKQKMKSNIKNIICHLRELEPLTDARILAFMNVLDQVYNGSNKEDDPRYTKVTFNKHVDYAFRSKFLSLTKGGKNANPVISYSKTSTDGVVVKCSSSNLANI